jgi:hypothetical protein
MSKPCLLLQRVVDYENGSDESFWDCELDEVDGASIVKIDGIDVRHFGQKLVSGVTTLYAPGIRVANDRAQVPPNANPVFGRRSDGRRLATVTGDKSVLVLRIKAADATTSSSVNALGNEVFGTTGSLKSQYELCSNDQLRFVPAENTPVVSTVTNGVYQVEITNTVAGVNDNSVIRNAAINQAKADFGVTSLTSIYDHVMVCIPPGTGDWLAYAYVNSWMSAYNDSKFFSEILQSFGLEPSVSF